MMPAYASFFLLLRYLGICLIPAALLRQQLLDSENLVFLSLYSFLEYCVCNISAECYYC